MPVECLIGGATREDTTQVTVHLVRIDGNKDKPPAADMLIVNAPPTEDFERTIVGCTLTFRNATVRILGVHWADRVGSYKLRLVPKKAPDAVDTRDIARANSDE